MQTTSRPVVEPLEGRRLLSAAATAPTPFPPTLSAADDGALYLGPGGRFDAADFALDPRSTPPLIDAAGDVDTYFLAADQQGVYTLSATAVSGTVAPALAVYNAADGVFLAGTDDAASGLDVALTVWQRVVVAVADADGTGTGAVALSVTGPPQPTLPVPLDGAGRVSFVDTVNDPGDSDYFRFVVPGNARGAGVISLAPAAGLDVVLGLYDGEDVLVALADAGGPGVAEAFSASAVGGAFTPGDTLTLRVGSSGYRGGAGTGTLLVDFAVTPETPSAPRLVPFFDTGISDSDGVTNVNDDLRFQFQSVRGLHVQLFRGTFPVSARTPVTSADGMIVLGDTTGLQIDGTYAYTAVAFDGPDGAASERSAVGTLTVDTRRPRTSSFTLVFDEGPRDQRFRLAFDEPVFGLTVDDLTVLNVTTGQTLDPGLFRLDAAGESLYELVYHPTAANNVLPDGVYRVTVAAGGATDRAGNANVAFEGTDFILAGDATRDGRVTISDFAVVRSNFGRTNATWTQGDFNNDGRVTISDFAIVRSSFGRFLDLPASPTSVFEDE